MNRPELYRIGLVTKERGLRGELSVMPLTDDPGRFRGLRDVYIEETEGAAAGKRLSGGTSDNKRLSGGTSDNKRLSVGTESAGSEADGKRLSVGTPDNKRLSVGTESAGSGVGGSVSGVRTARIESVRFHKGQVIVKFEGCGDADGARRYRGCYIAVTREQLAPLGKDRYYIFDLIGCAVYGTDGAPLGELADVLETGSNDVYVVRPAAAAAPAMPSSGNPDDPGGGGCPEGEPQTMIKTPEDILLPAIKSVVKEVDVANKRIVVDPAALIRAN